jgi:P-type E1-E2 ATPase
VVQFAVFVFITFFFLLSGYIEDYSVDDGRQTIVLLEKSAPRRAPVRRKDGLEQEVDVQRLRPKDIVIVREGERIPVGGTIVFGSAFITQVAITGESQRFGK